MSLGALRPGSASFQVTELPAYAPSGEGEHLYVELETTGLTTDRAAGLLAAACGVTPRSVGYAGRKDRHAVTRQWFSVLGGDPAAVEKLDRQVGSGRIEVLRVARHRNKLRRGHLAGNRFRLGIRLDEDAGPTLAARLAELERCGLPNRFGPQRFGVRGSTLAVARAWGRGEPAAAVAAIVDPDGGWRPGEPLPATRGSGAQRAVLSALRRDPDGFEAALRVAGRSFRQLVASAAQSAIFNAVLEARSAAGLLYRLREGDLAQLGLGPLFLCRADELQDVNRRAAPGALEVFATGPLPGSARFGPDAEVVAEEQAWSAHTGIDWAWFARDRPLASRGARRALVARLLEPARTSRDEAGTWLEFALPPGSYATELLPEVGISVPERRSD